jgi:hypothetical protein
MGRVLSPLFEREGVKVFKRPLVNEVVGLLLRGSSPIRPTMARHLYSVASKEAFSFASRLSNLSDMMLHSMLHSK